MPTARTTGPDGTTGIIRKRRKRRRVRVRPRPAAVGYSDKIPARRMGRLIGFTIDKLLLHTIVAAFGTLFAFVGGPIFSLLYFAGHDVLMGPGRSLGRAAAGQKLMSADGEDISHGRAAARNAVRWLLWTAMIPLLVDICLVLFGNGRIIADYIFNTRVYEDPLRVRQRFLAEGKDEDSLRAAEADLWAGDVEDEFMEAARQEIEEIERNGAHKAALDDFEDRLTGERPPAAQPTGFDDVDEGDEETASDDLHEAELDEATSEITDAIEPVTEVAEAGVAGSADAEADDEARLQQGLDALAEFEKALASPPPEVSEVEEAEEVSVAKS